MPRGGAQFGAGILNARIGAKRMKVSLERSALLKSLAHVQSVVERRNTIPILSNVLISAEGNHLGLTATDLDIEIVDTLEASVAQPGAVTAPAHMLYDIVRKLPDGAQVSLDFDADESRFVLQSGRSQFKLTTLPRDDFPAMPASDLPHQFALDVDSLKRLIDNSRFAISTEETRYYLNGIYMHALEEENLFRAVATDGHRLARVETPCPNGAAGMPGIIVPRKAVQEVRKLLDDAEGQVEVALSANKIRFQLGEIVLTSKLIDGTFPDYERVIPSTEGDVIEVEGADLKSAVDRVAAISTERARAVKLALEGERLTLSVNNPDSGSATEELIVAYAGDGAEIGFNAKYLLDIMDQISGRQARIFVTDAQSPTIIRDTDDDGVLYVLMPMRV